VPWGGVASVQCAAHLGVLLLAVPLQLNASSTAVQAGWELISGHAVGLPALNMRPHMSY
jgi:hypothetical protein